MRTIKYLFTSAAAFLLVICGVNCQSNNSKDKNNNPIMQTKKSFSLTAVRIEMAILPNLRKYCLKENNMKLSC